MSYRLMRICWTSSYGPLFDDFLSRYEDLDFEETMQKCRENGYLYPGSIAGHLVARGAEVMEILVDSPALQKKWLRENGHPADGTFDKNETFFRQLRAFQPDIVYFQSFFCLDPSVRYRIRSECPSVKVVCGHRGFPLMDCRGYEDIDAVFLGYPRFHDRWHAVGVRTFLHLHCFDEALLPAIRRRASEIAPVDFSFIGTTGWGFVPHDGRYHDLKRMLDTTGLVVFGNEPEPKGLAGRLMSAGRRMKFRSAMVGLLGLSPEFALRGLAALGSVTGQPVFGRAANAGLRRKRYGPDEGGAIAPAQEYWFDREKPIRELYPDRLRPPHFGLDYLALLAASKVTWNRHLEMDGAGANMRLFEACGAGACQLVDHVDEVIQAFEPDREIVTYRSIEECIEKAKCLADHEDERAKIAAAGQARALKDHSVAKRAEALHEDLLGLLRERSKPSGPAPGGGMQGPPEDIWAFDRESARRRLEAALIDEGGLVYLCVRDFLPEKLYRACMEYWPDSSDFVFKTPSRARITMGEIDSVILPAAQREFWRRFGNDIVNGTIKPLLTEVFLPFLDRKFDWVPEERRNWIRENLRFIDHHVDGLNLDRNYKIEPHVDQQYIFVTSLLYMPADDAEVAQGTWLYKAKDASLRTRDIEYLDPDSVAPYRKFPFYPNTLVCLLQTPTAFHGKPLVAGGERRSYQFNVVMDHALSETIYGSAAGSY